MTLQNFMDSKKVTQGFLANKIGKTQQAVSRWVNGKCSPSPNDILKLAEILGVSEKEILECFKKEA